MINSRRRSLIIPIGLLLIVVTGSCATVPPPSEREQLGTIGIVLRQLEPKRLDLPARGGGEGAARGAAAGAHIFSGHPALWILIPLGATFGAMAGAATADDEANVKDAQTVLLGTLGAFRPGEAVRDRLIDAAANGTRHSVVALPSAIETQGADTILELTVREFRLTGDGPVNPPFVLVVKIQARLLRAGSLEEIRDKSFTYESTKRSFLEWAVGDAQPLREEFDRLAQRIARDIVTRMFPDGVSKGGDASFAGSPAPASVAPVLRAQQSDETAIKRVLDSVMDAINESDLNRLLDQFADDARIDSKAAGGKVSKQRYGEAMAAVFNRRNVPPVRHSYSSVVIRDAAATINGTIQLGTRLFPSEWRVQKRAGRWVIVETFYK